LLCPRLMRRAARPTLDGCLPPRDTLKQHTPLEVAMRVDAHEQRALQLEHAATLLGDPAADPDIGPSLIENYWAAGFHWVAYGCQRKHGRHKENHTGLGRYLDELGDADIAVRWNRLERTRQGALYAYNAALRCPTLSGPVTIGRPSVVGQPHDTETNAQCHA